VHDQHVEANLWLLDDVCFIPFRRQEHEVPTMLKEIIRQAALPGGGLGQVIREAVPPDSRGAPPEVQPEMQPEPQLASAFGSDYAKQVFEVGQCVNIVDAHGEIRSGLRGTVAVVGSNGCYQVHTI
jgi:hypothetical protein